MAVTSCFFVEYNNNNCIFDVLESESCMEGRNVKEPTVPKDQPVSMDLAITGKTNRCFDFELSFCA